MTNSDSKTNPISTKAKKKIKLLETYTALEKNLNCGQTDILQYWMALNFNLYTQSSCFGCRFKSKEDFYITYRQNNNICN